MIQWQSARPGRDTVDFTDVFKDDVKPFLVQLTMVESDPCFEVGHRPGKVVEAIFSI